MEPLRETLLILFRSQNSETWIQSACSGMEEEDIFNTDRFCRCLQDFSERYTYDHTQVIADILQNTWMNPVEEIDKKKNSIHTPLNVLLHFTFKVMVEQNGYPCCRFEDLLRFNDLTGLLGEDLFTTSFLAEKDVNNATKRRLFDWPLSIDHNNENLNRLFHRPLSDIHFHLYGSSSTFCLSWLSLMNRPEERSRQFKAAITTYLNPEKIVSPEDKQASLYSRVIKAAAIRYYLYMTIMEASQCESIKNISSSLLTLLRSEDEDEVHSGSTLLNELLSVERQFEFRTSLSDYDYLQIPSGCILSERVSDLWISERFFMYTLFRKTYEGSLKSRERILFYAYLIIKSQFFSEMIQNNERVGFSNFSTYQDRKQSFIYLPSSSGKDYCSSVYSKVFPRMAIGSFVERHPEKRYVEARIAPWKNISDLVSQTDSLIQPKRYLDIFKESVNWQYRYTFHFIKSKDNRIEDEVDSLRCHNYQLRKKVRKQARYILKYYQHCTSLFDFQHEECRVVGIDAAGSELAVRPETFAQAYRFLRGSIHSIQCRDIRPIGFTFHCGEDFYDIVDGLRAVDELVHFMQYHSGDRIGHGLVLGVNVEDYYQEKHHTVLIPAGHFLDNIVWMLHVGMSCPSYSHAYPILNGLFHKWETSIYENEYSCYDMYEAWLLRGDNPSAYTCETGSSDNSSEICLSVVDYETYNYNKDPEARIARRNESARNIYWRYHYDIEVKNKSYKKVMIDVPPEYISLASEIQQKMFEQVQKRGLAIETNPTSNLRIGGFGRYDYLPLLKFYAPAQTGKAPGRKLSVSINTDDKGVFDTTLEREYSLMAAALEKQNKESLVYNPLDIYEWLDNIRMMTEEQRF